MLIAGFAMTSCDGLETNTNDNESLIVGKWKSINADYYEVYNPDGTGKMWNEDDDVSEEEADTFTWQFESDDKTKFTQYIEFQHGTSVVPQMCNILDLTESSFTYNNDGWRRTERLKRIN